jgi:hypothetical protein
MSDQRDEPPLSVLAGYEAELDRLRTAYGEAVSAEERLGAALRAEQAKRARLTDDLRRLRNSEAFRFGHALIRLGVAMRRPVALWRRARDRVGGGRPELDAPVPLAPLATQSGRLPPTLFVLWNEDGTVIERVLERVTRLQLALVDVEPIFVTDATDLEPFRRHGYAVDQVLGREAWSRRRPPHEWGAYVAERLDAVVTEHRPMAVIVLDDAAGLRTLDQGVLNPLLLPALRRREDNLLPPRP